MRLFRVKGESMYPFLRDDDLVLVRNATWEVLRRGNILVFKGEKKEYIIHRMIKKGKGDSVYLKGDGYNLTAKLVGRNAIIGKTTAVLRGGRVIRIKRSSELISWGLSFLRRCYISMRKKAGVGYSIDL